jgi:hypothetical protein
MLHFVVAPAKAGAQGSAGKCVGWLDSGIRRNDDQDCMSF